MSDQVTISLDEAGTILSQAEDIAYTIQTNGWEVIMEYFRRDAEEAQRELLVVDPQDVPEVTRLQNRANRYYAFQNAVHDMLQQAASITAADEITDEGYAVTE